MRWSHYFLPTLRESPAEAEVVSHKLMLRAGMIRKVAAGVFSYLPLGYRSLKKVENIVREEMNRSGSQELLMPVLQPRELWEESGRWKPMEQIMWRLTDKNKRDFCLGPTHEEVITDIVRNFIRSYKQLPISFYQIQTKFRDEIRPRFGLMRGREFLMKDAYSFHVSREDALREYEVMYQTYRRIFSRCGLNFRVVDADTGDMGGSASHEFQVLAKSGEDEILSCSQCEYSGNINFIPQKEGEACAKCKSGQMEKFRGIEVGHIFCLGTKYSKSLKADFLNEKGESLPFEMGCYGIGVSRTMAAAIEQNHDEKGMIWPIAIAPFKIAVVPLDVSDEKIREAAFHIYEQLLKTTDDVIIHDRDERAGVKFSDLDLIGIPIRVTIGSKSFQQNAADIKLRHEAKEARIPLDEVVTRVLHACHIG